MGKHVLNFITIHCGYLGHDLGTYGVNSRTQEQSHLISCQLVRTKYKMLRLVFDKKLIILWKKQTDFLTNPLKGVKGQDWKFETVFSKVGRSNAPWFKLVFPSNRPRFNSCHRHNSVCYKLGCHVLRVLLEIKESWN